MVVLALSAAACDEQLADVAGPTPNLTPTLSSIQREIFNTADSTGRLACIQCHTNVGRTPSAGLNLVEGQSYAALVGIASRNKPGATLVVAGNPDASYLIHKVEGRADITGVRMPRSNGPYLTSGQISIIRRWIELGAKND
jgi:Planctomycete cytochrome C